MGSKTTIEWVGGGEVQGATWNCLRGCSPRSSGCAKCYAERDGGRFAKKGEPYEGLVKKTASGWRWTGVVKFLEEHLRDPLRWTKPRFIFVNSVSDLFHETLPVATIVRILAVMALARRHTFQTLSKREDKMARILCDPQTPLLVADAIAEFADKVPDAAQVAAEVRDGRRWPLPNVWWGMSVEDQENADRRIPQLLRIPAAVRWISAEPLLGPIDLAPYLSGPRPLDWIVGGGESGPKARPCSSSWLRSILEQSRAAQVPPAVFIKQLGVKCDGRRLKKKGGLLADFPEDLRVREYPTPRKPSDPLSARLPDVAQRLVG